MATEADKMQKTLDKANSRIKELEKNGDKKGVGKWWIAAAVVLLLFAAGLGWWGLQKNSQVDNIRNIVASQQDTIAQLENHIDTLLYHSNDGKTVVLKVKDGVWTGETSKEGIMNGNGLLLYSSNDKEGRVLFAGKMIDGNRNGKGILLYNNGVFFDGEFANDNFKDGVYKVPAENMYFNGSFKDNTPLNGKWYNMKTNKVVYNISNGKTK